MEDIVIYKILTYKQISELSIAIKGYNDAQRLLYGWRE